MEIGSNSQKTNEENKSLQEEAKQLEVNNSISKTAASYGSRTVLSSNININNRTSISPASPFVPPPVNIITMSGSKPASSQRPRSSPSQVPDLLRNVAPEDVISYQRVKKIIIDTSNIDDEIQARENYLNHLKSIDLTKFSFPNESSYLSECKHLIDDSLGMPNLCRRGRKSPNSSYTSPNRATTPSSPSSPLHLNSIFSNIGHFVERVSSPLRFSSPITQTSTATVPRNLPTSSSPLNTDVAVNEQQSGFYDYFKCALLNTIERSRRFSFTRQRETTSTTTTTPLRSTTPKRVTFKESPEEERTHLHHQEKQQQVNRNLNKDLEGLVSSSGSEGGGDDMNRQSGGGGGSESTEIHSSSSSSSRMILRGSSSGVRRQNTTKLTTDRATMTNGDDDNNGEYVYLYASRSSDWSLAACCCSRLFWLLLLLLIPLALFVAGRLDESDSTASRMRNFRWYLEPNEQAFESLFDLCKSPFVWLRFLLCDCLPNMFGWLFAVLIRNAPSSQQKSTDRIFFGGDLVPDFKPATSGGYDMSLNILSSSNQSEIVSSLNTMKEKIMSEIMLNLGENNNQLELVRRELDQKFNYTLTLMLNKLADQLEAAREQESELSRVKSVLDELDTRYKTILTRLQEQSELIKKYEQSASHQQQQQQQNIKESFSDEHVSFRTLEEYVHRTFQIYNADRTGKTDFASESIGGSVLFTRCTETYLDNARWFTVFDVPITRITVSPRVVIQNSIQPGNCWSFKGSKADLFIKLAAKITPTSFSIEHIPKELSLTGLIDSAPQNFTVYGYESKDLISDDKRFLLGNYRYDNESKNTLQFFDAQYYYPDTPIAVVELKIESNAGNKDYTCLYKFRVHGRLFRSDFLDAATENSREANEDNAATVKTETTHRRIQVESSSSSSSNSNANN